MPRARDAIVPVAVKGIEEVVSMHTRTKRGTIRTTEKVIPIVRPPRENSRQPGRPIKKGKQPEIQTNHVEDSEGTIPIMDHTQEYDLPDVSPEHSHATVCIRFH